MIENPKKGKKKKSTLSEKVSNVKSEKVVVTISHPDGTIERKEI